eukprot:jgi/Mesvir1/5817/Mv03743-RA.1
MSGPPAGTSPVGLSSLTQRTGHDDATTDNKAISQLRSEVHNFIATLPLAREGEEMIATLRSWFLVYTLSGELSVYALGSDEDDELALCELVRTLVGVLKSLARKAPLTEGALLDVVGPVHLALDEVIAGASSTALIWTRSRSSSR